MAVGASTYEIVVSHTDRPWDYSGRPMFVFTHRDDLPVPEGADVASSRARRATTSTRCRKRRATATCGCSAAAAASQFADDGLLDELIVAYVPVVLGEGIPLFARGIPGTLTLTKSEQLPDSMVSNTYSLETPSR